MNGSGFLQAQKATDTNAVATTADGLDSLAFGYVPGSSPYTTTKTFTVSNKGSSSVSYTIAYTQPTAATVSALPASFTVPAGGSQDVAVTLTISSAQFAALPSASTFVTGPGAVVTRRGAVTAANRDL